MLIYQFYVEYPFKGRKGYSLRREGFEKEQRSSCYFAIPSSCNHWSLVDDLGRIQRNQASVGKGPEIERKLAGEEGFEPSTPNLGGTHTILIYRLYTLYLMCIRGGAMTEVLSVRVKKSLKHEAEKLGVDLKVAVEELLEELVAEKKANAQKIAKELRDLMDVKPEEWVNDVRATRHEM